MDKTERLISLIEEEIASSVPSLSGELSAVPEMLRYSLESGGKRVRPLLCLLFCEGAGEANALLAGDALLTHAFYLIAQGAREGRVTAEAAVGAAAELSRLCGAAGMIGGQYIDLAYENREATADVLFQQDALKTAALIEAACVMGLLAAGADDAMVRAAREFALGLGMAFQITDDLLETAEEGVSSDEANGKATYVGLLGEEEARARAKEYTDGAIRALDIFGDKADALKALAGALLRRTK